MRMRHIATATLVILVTALAIATEAQQGKGKPTSTPATALFRCPGLECPVADPEAIPPVLTDAITADLPDTLYLPADGAKIDTVSEFALSFEPTGRSVLLDFTNGPAPCVGCRRTFQTIAIDDTIAAVIHTNVIDPNTGNEASLGLRSVPVGATWPSRLKIGFNTLNAAGQVVQWSVRFNPRDYAPSDHIRVTRTGLKQWVLYATAAERAMLVSTCCKQRGLTNEGLYVMPFRWSSSNSSSPP